MSIAKKAGKASILLFFKKGWGGILSLFVMAYLARTLDVKDFGLLAISSTLITFIKVFAISGISEYVIYYNKDDKEKVVNTSFWLNIILTVGVIIIIYFLTPLWARFYDDPNIINIVYLLLISFFFNMLSAIPVALYRKKIDYKEMVVIQIFFGTITQLSQVLFAFLGFGVYSLVLPAIIFTPMLSLSLVYKSKFRPKLQFDINHCNNIFNYTKYIIGSRIIGMLVNNGDNLIIAKVLSIQVLGIYDIAFKLSSLFINHFNPIITNISLPVLAEINQNKKLLIDRFIKMIEMISVINMPIIVGMILFAEPIILLLYGQKWEEAILPFQILSIFVLFRSIGSPASGLYNAIGKPKIGFYFTMIYVIPFFAVIYIGTFYNLIGFCIAIASIRVLGSSTHLIIASKLLEIKLFKLIQIPLLSVFSSVISFIILIFIKNYFSLIMEIILYVFLVLLIELGLFNKYYSPIIKNFKSLILQKT